MRPSAKLNANGKLWVFAIMEVGEFSYIFIRRSQLEMPATDFMLLYVWLKQSGHVTQEIIW